MECLLFSTDHGKNVSKMLIESVLLNKKVKKILSGMFEDVKRLGFWISTHSNLNFCCNSASPVSNSSPLSSNSNFGNFGNYGNFQNVSKISFLTMFVVSLFSQFLLKIFTKKKLDFLKTCSHHLVFLI